MSRNIFRLLLLVSIIDLILAAPLSGIFKRPDFLNDTFDDVSETDQIQFNEDPDNFVEFLINADEYKLQNELINQQKYNFILNNKDICKNDVFVLILVKSTPRDFVERQDIRKTWGSVKTVNGANIVTVFTMGRPKLSTESKKISEELAKEMAEYGDIVQGDFIEDFKNQTYKSIMSLTWARKFCNNAQYILRTSDITMIDIFHLVKFLQKREETITENQDFLYCSTFFDNGPVRDPSDALFVTKNDYPFSKFPPHCEGFAYAMSNQVADKLLQAAKSVPFLWLDDVYVTGLLAAKAEVSHTDMLEKHGYTLMRPEHENDVSENSLFLLAKFKNMKKHWDNSWKNIVKRSEKI